MITLFIQRLKSFGGYLEILPYSIKLNTGCKTLFLLSSAVHFTTAERLFLKKTKNYLDLLSSSKITLIPIYMTKTACKMEVIETILSFGKVKNDKVFLFLKDPFM